MSTLRSESPQGRRLLAPQKLRRSRCLYGSANECVSQYELHKEILESKRYLLPGMGAPIQFPGTSLADGVIACTAPGGPTHAVTDPVHRTSFATRMRSERVVSRSKSFRSANRFASESRCNVSPHPALPFLRITPSTLYALAARP